MDDRRNLQRQRTLRSGKIVFNNRRSVIDCVVRNLTADGACLQVETTANIPDVFDLVVDGDAKSRVCRLVWQSDSRIGVSIARSQPGMAGGGLSDQASLSAHPSDRGDGDLLRAEMLRLRAALDEVPFGVVLLDAETRAQFINRAFRRIWRLPDAKAETKPPFVALMYHGRDTRAYDVSPDELDSYVAERVALVKAGDPGPIDLRLTNGEVVRFQCTVLPAGGRMLSYTYVTDIVRRSDELEVLRAALDNVSQGVILLDAFLNAQFINRAARELWNIAQEQAERKPSYVELVNDARRTGTFAVTSETLNEFIARRISVVRAGNSEPMDIRHGDGRIIRSTCAVLPGGGRMLTYADITDLVERADQLETLATIDSMTGLHNRRQFHVLGDAEWQRFQRYHRPLALLVIDIDRFKSINDKLGHDGGDYAIAHIAKLCQDIRRASDVVARLGGDEFAMLLPETDLAQGRVAAERLRALVAASPLAIEGERIALAVSIGLAQATISMPSFAALMKTADKALYSAKSGGRNRIACAVPEGSIELDAAAE